MTPKQHLFVLEYRKDLNATQAAIRAGYSKKTAGQIGDRLLKNVQIRNMVAGATARQAERAELSAVRVLEEMRRLGFSNVKNLFDENGDLRPIHTLSDEDAACIAGIEVVMKNATAGDGKVDRVLKVKVWDKPKVMEMLGKHFALLVEHVKIEASDEALQALYAGRERAAKAKRGK